MAKARRGIDELRTIALLKERMGERLKHAIDTMATAAPRTWSI
jgi:hypothetical protein